jgi:hypothetical protein
MYICSNVLSGFIEPHKGKEKQTQQKVHIISHSTNKNIFYQMYNTG